MSKTSKLRALSRQKSTPDHRDAYVIQIGAEHNDRGACILAVSNVEHALQAAIENTLIIDDDTHYEALFESQDGAASTFSKQTSLARAIGVIGPLHTTNLTILRHVRNAFAHANLPISFETPEVRSICEDLHLIEREIATETQPKPDWPNLTTRQRFIEVCNTLSYNLTFYSLGAAQPLDDDFVTKMVGEGHVGFVQRKALS